MRRMNIIYRSSTVLIMIGMLIGTSGCGESTSPPDQPAVVAPSPVTPTTSPDELTTSPAAPPVEDRTVRGTLVKIEGDKYMAKDLEGIDQVFTATPDTLIDGGMTAGDQIIVKLGKEGNAIAIRKDR